MKKISHKFLVLALSIFVCYCKGKVDTISIESAISKKMILTTITGKGGHQDKCINIKIKSLVPDSFIVHVEAGRRLDSKDSTEQDILVVKDEYIVFSKKNKEVDATITGFCCQASNHSPKFKSLFKIGKLAKGKLFEIAQYIKGKKLSTISIQYAIWCISDNQNVTSIVRDGTDEVILLRKQVALLKGVVDPPYDIYYDNASANGPAFSGKLEKLSTKINYYVSDLAEVMLTIRNSKDGIVYSKRVAKDTNRGEHTYQLNWIVKDMPAGTYTLRLFENGKKIKEMELKLN